MDDDIQVESLEDSPEEALNRLFVEGREQQQRMTHRMRVIETLISVLDAGIDQLAMEGASKEPETFGSLEGQNQIRDMLTNGVSAALESLGVSYAEIIDALTSLFMQGVHLKGGTAELQDRLKVWDSFTIANMLYGPRMTGAIFSRPTDETPLHDAGSCPFCAALCAALKHEKD